MALIKDYDDLAVVAGIKFLASGADASQTTDNVDIDDLDLYYLSKRVTVPASATDTGTRGDYAVSSGFFYQCVATDTWERVATATW